ncbi:hypothetical protein [Candidatus Lokiarchaeum ossiferum]|uniref:hypothetical protein n=1 Tax=Candidatus Lokiarchaeum ossiferum TaxID=2951803 RepID=UPI00352C8C8E
MNPVPLIDEIWILTENGLTLYNEQFLEEQSADLFGGFISAINAFASEIGMEEVQMIKGKNYKLTLAHYEDHRLTFVVRTPLDQKDTKIISYLGYLKKKFVDYYAEDLLDWKGEMEEFKEIKELFDLERDQLEIYQKNIYSSIPNSDFLPEQRILYDKIEKEE